MSGPKMHTRALYSNDIQTTYGSPWITHAGTHVPISQTPSDGKSAQFDYYSPAAGTVYNTMYSQHSFNSTSSTLIAGLLLED